MENQNLHKQLNGWDGYSEKGEAVCDSIFEQEKQLARDIDCRNGICECCPESMYYGLSGGERDEA